MKQKTVPSPSRHSRARAAALKAWRTIRAQGTARVPRAAAGVPPAALLPPLAAFPSAQLELVCLTRAIVRSRTAIANLQLALDNARAKLAAQEREQITQLTRLASASASNSEPA